MGNTPFYFKCPTERREANDHHFSPERYPYPERHKIVRTGRTKPNRSRIRSSRSLPDAHEWECLTCGKHGWSVQSGVKRCLLKGG